MLNQLILVPLPHMSAIESELVSKSFSDRPSPKRALRGFAIKGSTSSGGRNPSMGNLLAIYGDTFVR